MKLMWTTIAAAALLLTAGCQKTPSNATQNAPSTATDQNQAAQNPAGQGQAAAPGQQPANSAPTATTAPTPAPAATPAPPFQVAAGTSLPVVLTDSLSSKTNNPGDEFDATLASPVMVNGEVAIPKGSSVHGTVVDAKKQGTFKGEASLVVRITSITVRGKVYPISSSTYSGAEKGKGKRTAVVTGGGAALGALIGGLAGGGKGAAIGAGVGGGGGLAASGATGGKNVEFPSETRITFRLSQPITVDR
jgi:hypothetical protein